MTYRILVGDVIDRLRDLPSESVHCVVVSPPYYGLRDYGLPPSIWGGDSNCDHEWGDGIKIVKGGPHGNGVISPSVAQAQAGTKTINAGRFCPKCGAWLGCLGLEPTPDLFVAHMVLVFREVRRVLRSDGTLWLNIGDSYNGSGGAGGDYGPGGNKEGQPKFPGRKIDGLKRKDLIGIPWMLAFALRADGWYLRQDIVWAKGASFRYSGGSVMPESVTGRCTKAHEYLFLLTKSEQYFYDVGAVKEAASGLPPGNKHHRGAVAYLNGDERMRTKSGLANVGARETRNLRSVWVIPTRPFKGAHFATFPEALVEPCVKAGTSAAGVCEECGAPLKRVKIETGKEVTDQMIAAGASADGSYNGTGQKEYESGKAQNPSDVKRRILESMSKQYRHEFRRSCECNAGIIPATVLDPFSGSGTTGVVSLRLGRIYIGCELNPEYAKMSIERIEHSLNESPKVPRNTQPKNSQPDLFGAE